MSVVLVFGGRNFNDTPFMHNVLDNAPFPIDRIIQGEAKGADLMAKAWADKHSIPHDDFPADWANEGRSAGPKRNTRMHGKLLSYGTRTQGNQSLRAIGFFDVEPTRSKGSANMACQLSNEIATGRLAGVYLFYQRKPIWITVHVEILRSYNKLSITDWGFMDRLEHDPYRKG